MTVPTNPDGAEDVNDFLLRIRELGERRDKEDEERTKKLEEEILQGRKERQARRAERARSIAGSPTFNSFRLSASSIGQPSAIDPPEQLEPTLQTPDPETPGGVSPAQERDVPPNEMRRGSVQDTEMNSPSRAMPTMSRSRAGTLSWQQRPSSRGFGSTSPGSVSPTRSSHLRNASTASDASELSRAQIAQSLSSKDPSWFRQTPDRGLGSPAFRKPEERSDSPTDMSPGRRLPGFSRDSTAEPEGAEEVEARSPSPPRTASTVGDSNLSNRYSSVSSVTPATVGSPVTLSETPKLDPSQSESTKDPIPASPTQRRMSPERARSTSPTKGMGGFVQSAMMRRSDSVSKRWSAQLPQGLSRSNSIMSNRNSVAGPNLTASVSDMTPTSVTRLARDTSPLPSQKRPSSSHSEATVHPQESTDRPTTPSGPRGETRPEGSPGRPAYYGHSRSTSSMTADSMTGDTPSSPFTSRTMDPRRWSPTKASWLESALNRPESPRAQKQPPPQQPSWVRDRQSRGSVDAGRVNNFKEVTPIGLMRTPPPGTHFKKPSLSAPPPTLGPLSTTKTQEPQSEPESPAPAAVDDELLPKKAEQVEEEPKLEATEEPEELEKPNKDDTHPGSPSVTPKVQSDQVQAQSGTNKEPVRTRKSPPPALSMKPNFSLPLRDPISPRPKPQSPAIDFRANLRKREVTKDTGPQAEPEFKNVFGKLKKTETRNYVAPDELKGNILRGKAALNVTGGPKKSQRVDELKESILKRKEEMKAGGGSIRRNTLGEKDAPEKPVAAVPEAIAKRQLMNKTSSVKRDDEQTCLDSTVNQPLSPPLMAGNIIPAAEPEVVSPIPSPEATIVVDPEPSSSPKEARNFIAEAVSLDVAPEPEPARETASSVRGLPSSRRPTVTTPTVNPYSTARGKLAGRINPALANILSRGPPVAPENLKKGLVVSPSGDSSSATPSAPLTHMTKSRARGPKRRLPGGSAVPAAPAGVSSTQDITEVGAISSPEVPSSQTIPEPEVSPEPHSENLPKECPVPNTETARAESPVTTTQLPGVRTSLQSAVNSGMQFRLGSMSPVSPMSSISPASPISPISTRDADGPQSPSSFSDKENVSGENQSTRDVSPLSSPLSTKPTDPAKAVSPISTRDADGPQSPSGFSDKENFSQENRSLRDVSPPSSPFTTKPPVPAKAVSPISTRDADGPQSPSGFSDKENFSQENRSLRDVSPPSSPFTTKPPVPEKPTSSPSPVRSSPSTPAARPQWVQPPRYASPASPSPLRSGFRENQVGTPATTPQKPLPGVSVADSSSRSKALPSPPAPSRQSDTSLHKPHRSHRLSRKMSAPSLVAQAAEARELIAGFFRSFPNPRDRMNIDPQLMLITKPDATKIRTIKRYIWELTGDGKRQELPTNQEYVLYEGSMYLCVHQFESQGSSSTEVYLWCGDDVPEAALEDAQLFARKVGRENGCKLVVVRQGKEPVRFIQALGGIIITRRGFSSRSNSSALYMLCGRKHMGQMAFDEVDYSLRNLCSGFPFVISAPFGKLYLWKGRGSGPEETGAARLISMDLGLTGEFEECDEGQEPEYFFEDFAGSSEGNSLLTSDYWQLKPKYDHFRTRLLRVDHELAQPTRFWMRRPGSGSPVVRPNDTVQEIEPFCYKDLTEKDVYVLDTFFEIYVIVGEQASQKSADFASAVVFAHEYGILAASLQDRPFIPKSFVALGGIPDRCQSAFRKWDPHSLSAPCLFPLEVAIEAIRSHQRGE